MTVQELLAYVDVERLADVRQSRIQEWEQALYAPRDVYVEGMRAFVAMLQTLTPDPTPYEGEPDHGGRDGVISGEHPEIRSAGIRV